MLQVLCLLLHTAGSWHQGWHSVKAPRGEIDAGASWALLTCVLVELGWALEELQRTSTAAVMARFWAAHVNGSPFAIQLG